ncbi:MAG: transglycosylase SLT domain-containing protein [Gammaproteobacteria bacterium]
MAAIAKAVTVLLGAATVAACASSPPRNVANICNIFEERRSWYRAARSAERQWDIPMAVNMAFIYQESSFNSRARPERTRILWILPGPRPSSAFGYAQALESTWQEYEQRSGNSRASRSDFEDAIDFVAWYNANSNRISGIARNDAYSLYLAYHEGNGGYQRGTYREKRWLLNAASQVQANASRFAGQLDSCRRDLDKNWLQRLLS